MREESDLRQNPYDRRTFVSQTLKLHNQNSRGREENEGINYL